MDTKKILDIQAPDDIHKLNQHYEDYPCLMVDTETIRGKPYSVQLYWGSGEPELYYVNADSIMDFFYQYIKEHFQPHLTVWCFYAPFDFPILNFAFKELFVYSECQFRMGLMTFNYKNHKTCFGDVTYLDQEWHIRDAFQFVYRSLAKVADDLGIEQKKMTPPHFLGERAPQTPEEKNYFERYAKQDVIVLWHVVQWIKAIHQRYDVPLSVSLADLCGKIFRKTYFRSYHIIEQPSQAVMMAALKSYHGGKTECYVKTPVYIKDIVEYDIRSAYPWAMMTMPNFFDYEIQHVRGHSTISTEDGISPDGIYCVTGKHDCPYTIVYDDQFQAVKEFSQVWITGYELLSMVEHDSCEWTIHEGYLIESDRSGMNPLTQYVQDFFEAKNKADVEKNMTERMWNKLALNALYGKFIGRLPDTRAEMKEVWKGGVLFNPLMATCVTGKLRGYLHAIEHSIQPFHVSTDSFITRCQDGETRFPGHAGLGGLRKEYQGDCLIGRRKLYVIFGKDGSVQKSALHGFYGTVEQFLSLWQRHTQWYETSRMIRLKEAMISRDPEKIAFMFQKGIRKLKLDWDQYSVLE